jgi:serine/threonine-protein phosphatase 2A regulatory subunit A
MASIIGKEYTSVKVQPIL